MTSVDQTPWLHPYLTESAIARFRKYSEHVWTAATQHRARSPRRLSIAFAVNMAQNMYKWAQIAARGGQRVTLYLHPGDPSALSRPEWEEFDGESTDLFDANAFLRANPELQPRVATRVAPPEGSELLVAYGEGERSPQAAALRARTPGVNHRMLLDLEGHYPYFSWAEALARHDVTYIASVPFPAFASGKPYCAFSVGGDLQFDCGRDDALGRAMRMSFGGARFILASNPHTLGHCRRLGFTNALYLPYPMDSNRYCDAPAQSRREWIARFGGETFILVTSRIDRQVKGYTTSMLEAVFRVLSDHPGARCVFLGWGADVERLKQSASERGMVDRIVLLPPVGKTRLIDYYRSSDIVLDHFVYGYYGATALEAASVGRPVVMRIRREHYEPLYAGDVAPVDNATTPDEVYRALSALIASPQLRRDRGDAMRQWLVRNHGEERTGPLLCALLQMAADGVPLPKGVDNPLNDALSKAEIDYHDACLQ